MKKATTILALFVALFAANAGIAADAEHGAMLFASPRLGDGSSGKSCLTCHEHGRDFSPQTLRRKQYLVMGNPIPTLAGAINFCIEVALRGREIPEEGKEMNDLIAYLPVLIRENLGNTQ